MYRQDEQGENGQRAWEGAVTRSANELFTIETELLILAPEVAPHVRGAARAARGVRDAGPMGTEDDIEDSVRNFRVEVQNAMAIMREMLGSGDIPKARFDPTALARIKARKAGGQ